MPTITNADIDRYAAHLRDTERASATISKYLCELRRLHSALRGAEVTKAVLLGWKAELLSSRAPSSVNGAIGVVNAFFAFLGWHELSLKPLKVQKNLFLDESKELTRADYARLVAAAGRRGGERLSLIIQTICATGIRVSELRFITVAAVQTGRAEITNKGKRRVIFLPERLRKLLRRYCKAQKNTAGAVFVTRNGNPVDRSNIWRDMKALCKSAGVAPSKVFPHNLRHLFARTFYTVEKDLSRLADILGHSSVNTTRIYIAESGAHHARLVEQLHLVLTT